MYDDVVLTKLLRQDRAIVIAGAAANSLLGWSYLLYQGLGNAAHGSRVDGHA